jgi:putative selenium metabolism protein SsnA
MNVIKNVRIYDFENYIENGYVIFEQEIFEVGSMKDYKKRDIEEIDGEGQLLMPSLVNGHSHIYSTFARGLNVDFNPSSFKELLEQLWWKLDRNIDNQMTYYSGIVSGVEYLKNGVTTIIDHHASGEIIGSLKSLDEALEEVQLRRVLCFESSDRFDIDKCIKENNTFISENNSSFSRGLFGLHAAFTLSDESLEKIKISLNNSPIHIHVAESIEDQDDSISKYNKRVINRLNSFDLINKNSIITHGLYLDDEELQIIKNNEAVIALNITSNMNNAVGLPNYKKMKDEGIKVIIGNDGISQKMTSEYQNLYYAMHHYEKSPIGFSFDDLIQVINDTYSYASDILNIHIGKIEKGYKADMLLIPYNEFTPLDESNIFGHLFFGLFNQFNPRDVYVNGEKLLSNYRVKTELKELYKKAKTSAQRCWKNIEKEGNL